MSEDNIQHRSSTGSASEGPIDPVSERRAAMTNILGSWDLEGAMPTGYGLDVVKKYVAGETDLDGAIELLREHDRNGGYSRHE